MTSHKFVSFGFGGFTLYPIDRTLLHLNKLVTIGAKEFEILCYFVQHPGTLIASDELAAAVWGSEGKEYGRNLPHHISRLRKVIGCDPRVPKYIKTIYAKQAYRFIAPVHIADAVSDRNRVGAQKLEDAAFQLTCHLFVPMFIGPSVSSHLRTGRSNQWIEFKEFKTDKGTLYILPSGFGVWHIVEHEVFNHVWEFAEWRKDLYAEILCDRHVMSIHTRELLHLDDSEKVLSNIRGKPSYVFSAQVLRSTNIRNQEIVDRALQLLAMPSAFETSAPNNLNTGTVGFLERKLLEAKTTEPELNAFGVNGIDQGFAGWDGLSYISSSGDSLEQMIIDFEVAVQSLWWMAKCVADLLLRERKAIEGLRLFIPDLKRQFAKIRNISAVETPSQRTMIEAVIKTSRLREMVDIAIELDNERPK